MFTTWDLVSICFYDGVNKPTIFIFYLSYLQIIYICEIRRDIDSGILRSTQ